MTRGSTHLSGKKRVLCFEGLYALLVHLAMLTVDLLLCIKIRGKLGKATILAAKLLDLSFPFLRIELFLQRLNSHFKRLDCRSVLGLPGGSAVNKN